MFFISIALLFGVGFTLLFYFLIPLSAWYLILWVPVGFICGVILLVLLLYIYLLKIVMPSFELLLYTICCLVFGFSEFNNLIKCIFKISLLR